MKLTITDLFNAYSSWSQYSSMTANQHSLFFALMRIWNSSRLYRKDEWISVANSTLVVMSGLNERTLRNVRDQLSKEGVLKIKKSTSEKTAPKYDITFWISKDYNPETIPEK